MTDIINQKQPQPNLITGGQPTDAQFEQFAADGYRTVINLRGVGESGTETQPTLMARLGLTYEHLPIEGVAGTQFDNARLFQACLAAAEWPVIVHCASGNRVGALFALAAALDGVTDVTAAIEIGRAHGLTGLEPHVRQLIMTGIGSI
ncbi:MAG: sulfur transferase domain-containing protein [Myxococcota bacterium]|nr:sulfur transferase domain-containing protein [Myxococcota bacterium]